jgi:nicotinate-nucleotide pyrophosphorylase (carboxylating)
MKPSKISQSKQFDSISIWVEHLRSALTEDQWIFDWTTRAVVDDHQKPATAYLVAKSDGVWVGTGLISAVTKLASDYGFEFDIQSKFINGDRFKKGDRLVTLQGPHFGLLVFERGFINLAAYASGIATATDRLVSIVHSVVKKWPKSAKIPRVTSTRKTLPGYKDVALTAVMAGGGMCHRLNLGGGVLLKENHIRTAGSITRAIELAQATAPHVFRIETEVTNDAELMEALEAGTEVAMLDNFSPAQVHGALKIIKDFGAPVCVEISGGLNETNIADYVIPGVDVLSVGSITHSVKSSDFSLLFESGQKAKKTKKDKR